MSRILTLGLILALTNLLLAEDQPRPRDAERLIDYKVGVARFRVMHGEQSKTCRQLQEDVERLERAGVTINPALIANRLENYAAIRKALLKHFGEKHPEILGMDAALECLESLKRDVQQPRNEGKP